MSVQDVALILGLALGVLLIVGTFRIFGQRGTLGAWGGVFLAVGIILLGLAIAGSYERWIGTRMTLVDRLAVVERSMVQADENDRHLKEAVGRLAGTVRDATDYLLVLAPEGEPTSLRDEAAKLHEQIRQAEEGLGKIQALAKPDLRLLDE